MKEQPDVLQGTLALMALETLGVLGPQQGYGNPRLEHEGSIVSQWGASERNRRARFYRLTASGRKQLHAEDLP